mmetsp:Transcript_6682/g.14586  ORF Transcript_6682/g.14586 Transcript_6682/m.14586 type:complete len:257 (-) Transcript_6682:249-1019(-)
MHVLVVVAAVAVVARVLLNQPLHQLLLRRDIVVRHVRLAICKRMERLGFHGAAAPPHPTLVQHAGHRREEQNQQREHDQEDAAERAALALRAGLRAALLRAAPVGARVERSSFGRAAAAKGRDPDDDDDKGEAGARPAADLGAARARQRGVRRAAEQLGHAHRDEVERLRVLEDAEDEEEEHAFERHDPQRLLHVRQRSGGSTVELSKVPALRELQERLAKIVRREKLVKVDQDRVGVLGVGERLHYLVCDDADEA